jgi:hypothetical protein
MCIGFIFYTKENEDGEGVREQWLDRQEDRKDRSHM